MKKRNAGFKYLIRLHFAEIAIEVTEANQRVYYYNMSGIIII